MVKLQIKKRPRGRPMKSNSVTIYPVHKELDVAEVSRAFIQLALAHSKKCVRIDRTGVKYAGL